MTRFLWLFLALLAAPVFAAESEPVRGHALTATLLTAENGVAGETLSAGLKLDLDEGWKTYWRSPGEVGLPPVLDWSGSDNIVDVALAYPAPDRFIAFDIQNFGYGDQVVFPLTVTLADGTAPARLDMRADLLVCADICIPETVALSLDLPAGGGIDVASAEILSDWVARVPGGEEVGISVEAVHLDDTALTLRAVSEQPFLSPDIFPELGAYASFDAPDLRLSDNGRVLWASLPVLSEGEGALDLTIVDGPRAATLRVEPGSTVPAPPAGGPSLWWILAIAALGGLILNLMPCVLPVLSIKLASALKSADRPLPRVRAGFLASAVGVLVFFAALALALIALKGAGVAVGWGVQFQQPIFLAFVIGLMTLFAANLFGAFEIQLGATATTTLAKAEGEGLRGDFATGAFAALMSTPCSAPFIGTAVTYALTSGPVETLAVFMAMGVGLAIPYLAVAARPSLVRRLPRPGPWMSTLKTGLGILVLGTVVWLLTVLDGAAGRSVALVIGGLAAVLLIALKIGRAGPVAGVGLAALVIAAAFVPSTPAGQGPDAAGVWQPFEKERLAAEVSDGQVVFVDVTADWCLTCVANKRLVLNRGEVADALGDVVALQADWTRPDPAISDYLAMHGRYGIPFNAVYGPGAPQGIALPELLTESAVLEALARAGG
ncbi:MAG: protein-disulfide reductase DsbD domain-containing protein [Pseudomonadota bacterium]